MGFNYIKAALLVLLIDNSVNFYLDARPVAVVLNFVAAVVVTLAWKREKSRVFFVPDSKVPPVKIN